MPSRSLLSIRLLHYIDSVRQGLSGEEWRMMMKNDKQWWRMPKKDEKRQTKRINVRQECLTNNDEHNEQWRTTTNNDKQWRTMTNIDKQRRTVTNIDEQCQIMTNNDLVMWGGTFTETKIRQVLDIIWDWYLPNTIKSILLLFWADLCRQSNYDIMVKNLKQTNKKWIFDKI